MSEFIGSHVACAKCRRIEALGWKGACLNCGDTTFLVLDACNRTEAQAMEWEAANGLDEDDWARAGHSVEADKERRRQNGFREARDLALVTQKMVNEMSLGYPAPYGSYQIEMPP